MNGEISYPAKNGTHRFFYGYIVVAAALLIMAMSHGAGSTFGIFIQPLSAEFSWSRATISGASSLCSFLMGFIAIIVGGLTDKFGPRIIIGASGLLLGAGYLLMSQTNTIWQLYLFYSVMIGIGISPADVSLLSTIARWFTKRRGIMSGIIKTGTGIGMLIMPIVVNHLIATYGWRNAYIILGSLILVIVIPLAQLLQRDPSRMRQLPYGEEQVTTSGANSRRIGLSLQEAIHTRQFWTMCAAYLTIHFCTQTILIHIAPHAVEIGISAASAASVLSTVGGISIIGRLVMGYAGDRIGNRRGMAFCFVILALSVSWLQLANEAWMLYLFASIYGIAHGGFFTLISPMVAELFGTESHGVILGIVIFSGTIGGAIGSVLAGHIFDITSSYQLAFLICAGVSIIGLILSLVLKPTSR